MLPIILASASPRRKELLEQLGFMFDVLPATKEERITKIVPEEIVIELSIQKAMEIADQTEQDAIIIGADTMVTYQKQMMGKPADESQAREMLRQLSGAVHTVYTGVTAIRKYKDSRETKSFADATEVTFYEMSEEEIDFYVHTREPMDKAGAYGIQGLGGRYVRNIRGDYNNVVGLPVARLYQEILKQWE